MSRNLVPATLVSALFCSTALADVPSVAVDIAPLHSLVARVMDGVGTPDLVIQPGASPHEYSLRPSDAEALEQADLVFWIGADLTPWMEGAVENLTRDANVVSLLEAEGTKLLDFREDALFEAHDHDEDHEDHGDDHAQAKDDDHDHDHDHDHAHDEHASDDTHDHEHGAHDPHAWLSIENADLWLNIIAQELAAIDPDNAAAYTANADAGRAELQALERDVSAILEPMRGKSFVVFHDAYQYFEQSFNFPAAGAISLSDASDPSPARIAEIQARVRSEGIACVLAEPQFNPGTIRVVLDGTAAKTGVLDPLGSDLEPGAGLYPQMMRNLANVLADCL